MYGPLPSNVRDSPAIPGSSASVSWYALSWGKPFEGLKLPSVISRFDHGITTLLTQLDGGRTSFFISGIVSLVSFASDGTVYLRSLVSPRSSDGCTNRRSWLMNGRL